MKNIAICADGTGNTTIKGRGTNVFKLYEAVDQSGPRANPPRLPAQVALYHDGVGTENLKWIRAATGAVGWGLTRNVKQLYGELARVYAPGDKLFLFGFSRGAFTVRTLAGLIHACGILDLSKAATNADFEKNIDKAYAEYRKHYASTLVTRLSGPTEPLTPKRVAELRVRFSVAIPEYQTGSTGTPIEFIGVWDTVDAVGLPFRAADFVNRFIYAFKFPDRTLNTSVKHACHALAIDEERASFVPVLWNENETTHAKRIEQVWFAGVHSNVGGGYPRQGMSLVTLDWIMRKAEQHGLRFDTIERDLYRGHADVDDKMYDSRAGLGVFYRWKPRDIQKLCDDNGVTPKVHRSVFERIARNTEGYAPGSIPPDPEVISLSQTEAVTDDIRTFVKKQHAQGGPLIERRSGLLSTGRLAYFLFVWGAIVVAGFMVKGYVTAGSADTRSWWEVAQKLGSTLISSQWVGRFVGVFWSHPWLIAWLALSLAVGKAVDSRLDSFYSEFWHNARLQLRRKLGLG